MPGHGEASACWLALTAATRVCRVGSVSQEAKTCCQLRDSIDALDMRCISRCCRHIKQTPQTSPGTSKASLRSQSWHSIVTGSMSLVGNLSILSSSSSITRAVLVG